MARGWAMRDGETAPAEQIVQVQPRVGRTLRNRLQWALDFARRDLDQLTVGDWANLQREFVAFRDAFIPPDAFSDPIVRAEVFGEATPRRRSQRSLSRVPSLPLLPWQSTE